MEGVKTITNAPTLAPAAEKVGQKREGDESLTPLFYQPRLTIGSPDDPLEKEADDMADKVMRMGMPQPMNFSSAKDSVNRKCAHCEEGEKQLQRKESGGESVSFAPPIVHDVINSTGGRSMDESTRSFMESRFNYDFSNVKIHDSDLAAKSASSINALAYTSANNVVFNSGQYNTSSDSGKRLLAHELTHVVQQNEVAGVYSKRQIQRTTIGEILDEFFSPFSSETLWNMDESDNYTGIVRTWRPVIDALSVIKQNIASDCSTWRSTHTTNPSWRPGRTDPPVTDPNAFGRWVSSPPGTDPNTCGLAFFIYKTSGVQNFDLYTCSIGSFGLYVTVDSIDCSTNNATIKVWMYNSMDLGSFSSYGILFPFSGMERQYMWWSWDETMRWSPRDVTTAPEKRRAGDW